MIDLPARGYRGRIYLGSFLRYRPLWLKYDGDEKLTDFQVKCVLTKNDIAFEKLRLDKRDLLFISYDGDTIPYWIEKADNTEIIAWLKFSEIIPGKEVFWLYYGNGNFRGISNGDDVFDFFDDFEGTEIDSNKWKTNSPVFSVENGIIKFWGDWNGNNYYLNTLQMFNSPKKIIGKWRLGQIGEDTDLFVGFRTSDTGVQSKNGYDCYYDGQGTGKYYEKSIMRLTEAYVLCGKVTDTEWHKFKIIFKTDEIKFWDDLLGECSMSGEGLGSFYLSIGADSDSSSRFAYLDYIGIAEYSDSEPIILLK